MIDFRTETLWLAVVMLGGSIGTATRYIIGRLALKFAPAVIQDFPWHTFSINILGSFCLGMFWVWYKGHPRQEWLLMLGVGFCGGLTTFSTFCLEILVMMEKGRPLTGLGYILGSIMLGLAAIGLAVRLARG
jgi:CrcB protein